MAARSDVGCRQIITLVLAVCTPLAVPVASGRAPASSQIAYMSPVGGNWEILAVDTTTREVAQLTRNRVDDYAPRWSPTGEHVAFYSDVGGFNWEVFVMRSDGTDIRRLTHRLDLDMAPTWYGDRTVAYTARTGKAFAVHTTDIDADASEPLGVPSGVALSWSPTARRFLYVSADAKGTRLRICSGDGDCRDLLTPGADDPVMPRWSPRGDQITFAGHTAGVRDVYTASADGARPTRMTKRPAHDSHPVWSPDGSQIAFSSRRDGDFGIYTMDAEGGNIRRLISVDAGASSLDWFDPTTLAVSPLGRRSVTWAWLRSLAPRP